MTDHTGQDMNFYLCLLSSVLTLLWKRLTDEGGAVSNTRQEAQPRVRFEHQATTGTKLQHNTLQSTGLRLVSVR